VPAKSSKALPSTGESQGISQEAGAAFLATGILAAFARKKRKKNSK
jgi:LPXTG-motif cell wall-anchored protein